MAIRIKYVDFWKGFDFKKEPLIYQRIKQLHDIKIVQSNPDILIASCYNNKHLKEKAKVKVFYTAERYDFNESQFDFSFSFKPDSKTNMYLPNYIRKYGFKHYHSLNKPLSINLRNKKGFCCFVHSNCGAKERKQFFHKLSKYKKIESSGNCLRNTKYNAPRGQKYFEYLSKFKFMITFENYSQNGYNTEKIYNALYSGVVPIYWGDPKINEYFNKDTFINTIEYGNYDKVIEQIKMIDKNQDLYMNFFSKPRLNKVVKQKDFDLFVNKIINSI